MSDATHSAHVWIALVVLLLIHTGVSLGAYRWLVKTTLLEESAEEPPVEVTTPEQAARGEHVFQMVAESQVLSRVIPTLVMYYVWAGYLALGVSAVMCLYAWIRYGHV